VKKKTRVSLAISAAFGAGLAGLAPGAVAQAQQQLERVEITGSSLRRAEAETALPVTIIRAEELIKQGITTVEQAIKTLPQNQTALGVSQGIGATTGGIAAADLRGLGASTGSTGQRTLVLLNGRRIANQAYDSGATDLNSIPMAAIDRIEVLRDGASAIYGTDAIGGVINFILRREYSGVEVAGEYQNPEEFGGITKRASLTGGFGSLDKQGFNIMATVDWRQQDAVMAADRPFGSTGILPARNQNRTSGTTFPGTVSGFNPTAPGCAPPSSVWNGVSCRYDFVRDIDLIPENEQLSFLARGTVKLGQHYISAEYLRAQNDTSNRVAPTPLPGMNIPSTSPFYPVGATGNTVSWRAVPAGKRTDSNEAVADRILLEANGAFGAWDYRAGVFQSNSEVKTDFIDGYVKRPDIQTGLTNGILNPFGAQTAAGTQYLNASKVLGTVLSADGKVTTVDARASRDVFQMAGGAAAIAIGAEWRKEEFSFDLKENLAPLAASSGLELAADIKGDRDVSALFAEMAFPITKTFEASLAVRYDNYSDFGGTFNPKLGVRWQPAKGMLFRGSVNTGFRAPTLYDIYQPIALTYTSDAYNDPVYCPGGTPTAPGIAGVVCDQQVQQRLSGPGGTGQPVDTLEPEESTNFNIGMVFEPMTNLTMSVDYWNIQVKNLISTLPEQAIFGDVAKYGTRIRRCSQLNAAEFAAVDACAFTSPTLDPIAYIDTPTENLGDMKTSGIDLSVGYRFPATAYGRFGVNLDGTYVLKYEYQREKGGEFIDAAGKYTDNAPVFRWQHALTFSWGAGPWGVTVAQNYKSGYTDQDPSNEVKSYQLWDATVTYTGIRNLTLMAGVRNLADTDPPYSNQATTFQSNYDPRYTDALGRTWLARVSYKFF
jgi:iron complex outermembrane recepter protein